MSFDSYFAGFGSRWDAAAKPSVHEHRPARQALAREVGAMFARMLSGDDRRRTAYHEAGHAFALRALGYPLQEVAVSRHGGGHTGPLADGPAWDPEDVATILLAGAAAERLAFGDRDAHGCADDDELLDEILAIAKPGAEARARAKADELVRTGDAAIRALAEVLQRRGKVSGPDATAILGEHGTVRTEQRSDSVALGPAGPQTIVIHGGRRNPRTGEWEPYRGTQTVHWPAAKAEAWNAMYAAADRGDDEAFHRWQRRLSEFSRDR